MTNWKQPRNDNIKAFLVKRLDYIHKYLTNVYNKWMNDGIDEDEIIGKTQLIYKGGEETDVKNYRQIT